MKYQANPRIRALLESAYRDFHSGFHRERDPISLVHLFPAPKDREVVALATALLSYGNVQTILNSMREVLTVLGTSPYRNILDLRFASALRLFKHRFTTGADLEALFGWTAAALRSHGSLEAYFTGGAHPKEAPMRDLLSDFVLRFSSQPMPKGLGAAPLDRARNLKYLLSDPNRGSACKRLNMYLRWMVRPEDGIDLGLWKTLKPGQLMLPVDTHVLKTIQALKWTKSKQATWRVAEEATARLRLYSPEDPIRYDFSLCHLSMSGGKILSHRRKWNVKYAKVE